MKYGYVFLSFFWNIIVSAQDTFPLVDSTLHNRLKPSLTLEAIKGWPTLSIPSISSDGRYFGYVIGNEIAKSRKLMLLSTRSNWQLEAAITGNYFFTLNSRYAVWINEHDSLCISLLGHSNIKYVSDVSYFSIQGETVLYHLKYGTQVSELHLSQNVEFSYDIGTNPIIVSRGKDEIIFLCELDEGYSLCRILNNKRHRVDVLWSGRNVHSLINDVNYSQIAFLSGEARDTLWYYKKGTNKFNIIHPIYDSTFPIVGLSNFSKDGKRLFVYLAEQQINSAVEKYSVANIWSYLDVKLQSQQRNELDPALYRGVVQLSDGKFTRIEYKNDILFFPRERDVVCLIRKVDNPSPGDESNWNSAGVFSWYIESTKSGKIKVLDDIKQNTLVQISPYGKYVIYYDKESRNYFSYDIASGNRCNVTSGIMENWEKKNNDVGKTYGRFIAGWMENDEWIFIHSEHDIWQIDPTGRKRPINLTNGLGRRRNMIFFFALEEYSRRCLRKNESIILSAFSFATKENGFYLKKVGVAGDPDSLTMDDHVYDLTDNPNVPTESYFSPIKALSSQKYIVKRMGFNDAPNFFITSDFRVFKRLSALQPHEKYNWYTSDMHTWKSPGNVPLSGILYKPENFDSMRKYPVILYYYEKRTDGLNVYIRPRFLEGGCAINIPYYVSHEYLVFCPDIEYKIGDPMQGTYEAVTSAVMYLSRFNYVDAAKIGIQGCSWGGVQTNYLITHSNLFAAACSSSGVANWISNYGSIKASGESMQGMYEVGQFRMGASLWENQNVYIKNSAVLYADRVSTPLLLMHTRGDGLCDIYNVFSFYSSLRRLGKKSWMLVYEGNHGVWGNEEIDFNIRMKQFFDHYLKNELPPKWMTKVVTKDEMSDSIGLELDSTGLRFEHR